MHWYKNLYIGENAKENKQKIIRNIKRRKLQFGAYVLALPESDHNILDIYPSIVLLQPYFKKKDLFVLGIASSKDEAYEVMEQIVMDSYRSTGAFDIKEYINGV